MATSSASSSASSAPTTMKVNVKLFNLEDYKPPTESVSGEFIEEITGTTVTKRILLKRDYPSIDVTVTGTGSPKEDLLKALNNAGCKTYTYQKLIELSGITSTSVDTETNNRSKFFGLTTTTLPVAILLVSNAPIPTTNRYSYVSGVTTAVNTDTITAPSSTITVNGLTGGAKKKSKKGSKKGSKKMTGGAKKKSKKSSKKASKKSSKKGSKKMTGGAKKKSKKSSKKASKKSSKKGSKKMTGGAKKKSKKSSKKGSKKSSKKGSKKMTGGAKKKSKKSSKKGSKKSSKKGSKKMTGGAKKKSKKASKKSSKKGKKGGK